MAYLAPLLALLWNVRNFCQPSPWLRQLSTIRLMAFSFRVSDVSVISLIVDDDDDDDDDGDDGDGDSVGLRCRGHLP